MTNTPDSVDWAVGKGANGVEIDVEFDSHGNPKRFIHSPKSDDACDCSCICPVYVPIHLTYFFLSVHKNWYYVTYDLLSFIIFLY